MPKFNKTNRTADDLIVVLKRKGLSIADEAKSINYIRNIGYYRLKAYFYPLYQEPKHKHLFKVDATFDKVMNMYRFDRKLRLLLFNEIEKIEAAFRSIIESLLSLGEIALINYVSPSCHSRTKSVPSPREAFVLWQLPMR